MGRKLNTTVQVGDRIYVVGTDESDIDGDVTADVWDKATASDDESGDEAKPATRRRAKKPAEDA